MHNSYRTIIQNLQILILNHSTSVKAFCLQYGYCRFNLSKIFNERSTISLHLFSSILISLGVIKMPLCASTNFVLLTDALDINSNLLLTTLHTLMFI